MASMNISIFDAQLRTELQAYTIGLIRAIHEKFQNIPYTELIELVTCSSPTQQQCIAQSSKTQKRCSHKAADSTGLCKKHAKKTSEETPRINLEYIQIQDQDFLYDHDTGIVYTYSKEPQKVGTLDSFVQNTTNIKIL